MCDLIKIPAPSQLDDWHLYERLEEMEVRRHFGDQGVLAWGVKREEDRRERSDWKRTSQFRATLKVVSGPAKQPFNEPTNPPWMPPPLSPRKKWRGAGRLNSQPEAESEAEPTPQERGKGKEC